MKQSQFTRFVSIRSSSMTCTLEEQRTEISTAEIMTSHKLSYLSIMSNCNTLKQLDNKTIPEKNKLLKSCLCGEVRLAAESPPCQCLRDFLSNGRCRSGIFLGENETSSTNKTGGFAYTAKTNLCR